MSLIAIILLVLIFCAIYIGIVWFTKYNSSRHWSSIPGFCMGIGIGVTFLSMYKTFQNFKKGNEIENLIPEISSAFIGSLLGLSISLLMTYWIKSRIAAIEEIEQKQAGENTNPYLLLQKIAKNTENLNTAFATFNTKTETLNSEMLNEFSAKFKEIMDSVKTDAIGQSLENINSIHKELSGKLETIFDVTNGTILNGQVAIKDEINTMNTEVSQKIDAFIASRIKSLEETFKRIEDYQTRSQTFLEAVTKCFKLTVERYENIDDIKKESIEDIKKQLDKLENIKLNEKGDNINKNWNELAELITNIMNKASSINNLINELDKRQPVFINQQTTTIDDV